jgi:hypothetical protein
VAVEVAASRADREDWGALARLAAVPVWVWLGGIAAASFAGRLTAAAGRQTPDYLPDEYIYSSLARSFAEHGKPLIRGHVAHFPALLDPIVTAPVWLVAHNPETAFRLTQGLHALFVSLAVVPAYLIARRVGVTTPWAIAVAALTVAVPDTIYASSMLADPLAYPLVLSAVYAGVCMVTQPTARAQVAFAALSAATVLARIQYAVVPVAVFAAEVVADRLHVVRALRRVWLALVLLVVPPALLVGTLGSDRVLGVYSKGNHGLDPTGIAAWLGREAMLLTYSSGWVIVPGALAALALALFRSRTRAELAFGLITVFLGAALLLEAAQIADTDSARFQERYLFALVPLLATAFALYVRRGLPARIPVALASAALLVLAARVPLSSYAVSHNKDDSPTLWAVLRLESFTSIGTGSLLVALIAGLLSAVAAAVAYRKLPAAVAVGLALAAGCALSAGATSYDHFSSGHARASLPADLRWVDHAHLGDVDVVSPPGAQKQQAWLQMFWNTSIKRFLILGSPEIDQFATKVVRVPADGRLLVDNAADRRPLLVQTYASSVQLTGVTRVQHERIFDLYRPNGTPRLHLIAAGRYYDGWLATTGGITVWPKQRGGTLRLRLRLPAGTEVTPLRLTAPGVNRVVRVRPGAAVSLAFHVRPGTEWTLHWRTRKHGYLGDREVSVEAPRVAFG